MERRPRHNDVGREPQNNFSTLEEDREGERNTEDDEEEAQEIGAVNDGRLHAQSTAPVFGNGADNAALVPVQSGAPRFRIGPRNNREWLDVLARILGFRNGAGNDGAWPVLAWAPRIGIGAGNDGEWPVLAWEPRFRIGAGNYRAWPVQGGAPNAVEEILERVCESIELDELAVEKKGGENPVCAICLYDLDDVTVNGDRPLIRLPCSHMFHSHCISNWFHQKLNCPMDRKPLGLP